MSKKYTHLDAESTIFFETQLEAVKSRSYDKKYPALKARTLIPVSFEAGAGAESISYEQFEQFGMAKIISNYARDLPRADVKGKKFVSPVESLGMSYGYSVQEIRAAQFGNKPLQQRKANAARRGVMEKENTIALFGDAGTGLKGLLNNVNVPIQALPADGTGASILWSTKTADLIIRDMNLVANTVVTQSKGVELPDTLLLPLTAFTFTSSTPRSNDSETTILAYFLANNPHIKNIEWLNELETAGAGSSRRMMAYRRDEDAITLEIPQDYEEFSPQEKGLEFEIPCHERIGGVIFYYPLSACYADAF